jgi:hypothetical protein
VVPAEPPPVVPPPAVEVDAGTDVAVAPPEPPATQSAEDKAKAERDRKRHERDRDKKSGTKTQPPATGADKPAASKCNNNVPGDTDCDGIPDTRL